MIALKSGYSIAIKGLIPDEEDPMKGEILLLGSPMACMRLEKYEIRDSIVYTDSWNFHASWLVSFLKSSGSVGDDGNVVLNKVLPKFYNYGEK